jgi:predicted negative regulator of RcsB-dependent stress response
MSAYDLEEQERIDALKDWWNQWKLWVYVGALAFILGAGGMFAYRQHKNGQSDEAEALFKTVQKTAEEAVATKDPKKLTEAANLLSSKYPGTFYATHIQLLAAKTAFDSKDLAAAKTHLQWVIDKGFDTHKSVARVRLASVFAEEKKFDDALKTLDGVKEDAFVAIAADLRGDINAAQGKRDEARAAYQIAVEKSGDRSALKQLSQSKLDAVGGAVVVASAPGPEQPKGAAKEKWLEAVDKLAPKGATK